MRNCHDEYFANELLQPGKEYGRIGQGQINLSSLSPNPLNHLVRNDLCTEQKFIQNSCINEDAFSCD